MNYRVLVNDIFGYMDQSRKYTKGEYSTYAEALAVCREIVDSSLRHECAPGMPSSALYCASHSASAGLSSSGSPPADAAGAPPAVGNGGGTAPTGGVICGVAIAAIIC